MKGKIIRIIVLVSIIALTILFSLLDSKAGKELAKSRQEVKELKQELAAALQHVPMERDTIRDTVEAVTSPLITAELKTLRKQHLIDEQLIRDLGLQLKQLEAVKTTYMETRDSVPATLDEDSTTFYYCDKWSDLQFSLQDTTFYYNIRDLLETIVYHEYKHRFLWWRWGVKGYKVTVVNFNPHSTIKYNSYVKPGN